MAYCLIVPFYLHGRDLRDCWEEAIDRRSLIDLDLARLYFRTPEVNIDTTTNPPTLREPQAFAYAKED